LKKRATVAGSMVPASVVTCAATATGSAAATQAARPRRCDFICGFLRWSEASSEITPPAYTRSARCRRASWIEAGTSSGRATPKIFAS
jgi:hypothetical protein